MTDQRELLSRQHALADFGEFVLDSDDLQAVLTEACRIVAGALQTDYAKILEIEDGEGSVLVRAGVGWHPGIVGHQRIPLGVRSSEAFAIEQCEPVVTQDLATEERFDFPSFMTDHGVVALVNVPILLPGRKAFGLLQVDSRVPRAFEEDDIQFLRTYAMVLGPVIDRLNKLRDLARTTERFRLIVEHAQDYAIVLTDAEDRIVDWLPGAEAVFGWSKEEVLGQSAAIMFTAEDRAAGLPEREIATARREGKVADVRWHVRKDGSRVFIEGQATAMRHPDGSFAGFMKIGQDVTRRVHGDEALRNSETRLRLAVETAQLGTWDWDMATDTIEWSDVHYTLSGYDVGEVVPSYAAWSSRLHPDDRAATEHALAQARDRREVFVAEFRNRHPDGTILWCSARGQFFYDEDGRPIRMIGAMRDVTERREWEERQQVLIHELQHRTRNLMGVVRSTASRTMAASADLAEFEARFVHRIDALARVQGLLSRLGSNDRIAFDKLLTSELSAVFGEAERVTFEGPPGIRLRSSVVQMLAMALHELATNAVKYGALRDPQGSLHVTWQLEPDGPGNMPWLHVDWRERGVSIADPNGAPRGTGQGRELIERALPYQLGAKTRFRLEPDGLHCTMSIPVSASIAVEEDDLPDPRSGL
ncbi:PAS domain S-box protein [Sphingomonas radiodurans]|uniref:PAS domain S-box protein n=1 Tax=Sphingomonas radiodurans TaxID=2890321 RepID=UPI001E4EED21|nr:PAS domain S-box protein [Sphingomonas radiodurans]WBH16232.1 PAS domain S-box protein [Sphingomonas radiodurans]